MTLEIVFPESALNSPVLIFREGEKISRCRRPRWVQLFALMVYRDQCGLGQRFVTAGDLEHLMSFRGTSLQSSVKWFTNTTPRLPALMREFIRDYTTIRHGGPYRLCYGVENIIADRKFLKQYMDLNYIPPKDDSRRDDSLVIDILKTGTSAVNSFDLETGQILYSSCMRNIDSTPSLPPTYKSLMYSRLAVIEALMTGHTPKMHHLYRLGLQAAMQLKNTQDRSMMLSFLLADHAVHYPQKPENLSIIMESTQSAIDLAKDLPRWSGDRASILMKIYYLRAILTTKFSLKNDVNEEIDGIKQSLKIIADDNIRTITPAFNEQTCEFMMLTLHLQRDFQTRSKVTDSILSSYQFVRSDWIMREVNTMGLVERIGQNYIRSNDLEAGLNFLTEGLEQHEHLQQFLVYRRVAALRQEILARIRSFIV